MTHHEIATTDNINRHSWRMDDNDQTSMTVATSARALGGNMSPKFNQYDEDLDAEQKESRAGENMDRYIRSIGLKPENTFIMLPQQQYPEELGIVNVDEVFQPGSSNEPVVAEQRADLLITRNPEVALVCRPADCPVLSIEGSDKDGNRVLAQLHVGWQGLNAGYLEQGITHLQEKEGVSKESLRIQMSGAGYAENFHYTNAENPIEDDSIALDKDGNQLPKRFTHEERDHLFVNVKEAGSANDQGQEIYSFDMDMPGFIRYKLEQMDIDPYQLYEEGSDTTVEGSGYSSHSRDSKDKTKNTRDAVITSLAQPDQKIIAELHAQEKGSVALSAYRR